VAPPQDRRKNASPENGTEKHYKWNYTLPFQAFLSLLYNLTKTPVQDLK
jgi:hypothetical protein